MSATSDKLVLSNARAVLPNRVIDSSSVIIENEIIARIAGERVKSDHQVTRQIDLSGLRLFPGFIDVHIHGAAGVDMMDATADDLRSVAEFLARRGVTAWLPTLVPAPVGQYEQAVRAIEQVMKEQAGSPRARARVLGVHYEGPFVNREQCGALHKEHFRTFRNDADVDDLPTIANAVSDAMHAGRVSTQALHMMTLAPEVEGGIDLIAELKKRNWIVSIGHTRADRSVLDDARKAGARHMTHFMNAMTPLHHRDIGAVGWGLTHDDVTFDLIADGIHIGRSILKLIVRAKNAERVSLISDAIAAAGMGDGDYEIWGEKISVRNGRTSNTRGSIAGSVITMVDAVRTMLSLGFAEPDIARMASLNPARLLGVAQDCGSIEEGKRADLVAIDENQNVRATIVGGKIAYSEL